MVLSFVWKGGGIFVSSETRSGIVLQGSDPWKTDLGPTKRIS